MARESTPKKMKSIRRKTNYVIVGKGATWGRLELKKRIKNKKKRILNFCFRFKPILG